jgi:hypothetical protein
MADRSFLARLAFHNSRHGHYACDCPQEIVNFNDLSTIRDEPRNEMVGKKSGKALLREEGKGSLKDSSLY